MKNVCPSQNSSHYSTLLQTLQQYMEYTKLGNYLSGKVSSGVTVFAPNNEGEYTWS